MNRILTAAIVALSVLGVFGGQLQYEDTQVWPSPDRSCFVISTDKEEGRTDKELGRSIVVLDAKSSKVIFRRFTIPRYTLVSWSPASHSCVIADAPDNVGPEIWLLTKRQDGSWTKRDIDLFVRLSKMFEATDHGPTLFRPSILRITWLSNSLACFRTYSNLGTYDITLDFSTPKFRSTMKKISDELVEP